MGKWLFLAIALLVNASANLLLKYGAVQPHSNGVTMTQTVVDFLNFPTIVAVILFAINVIFYRKALSMLEMSVAYPIMTSMGLVLVTTASAVLPQIAEKLGLYQILGIVLIIGGVFLVAKKA